MGLCLRTADVTMFTMQGVLTGRVLVKWNPVRPLQFRYCGISFDTKETEINRKRGSISGGGKGFFSTSQCPENSFVCNRYRVRLPG
jgi:hypothetical protein